MKKSCKSTKTWKCIICDSIINMYREENEELNKSTIISRLHSYQENAKFEKTSRTTVYYHIERLVTVGRLRILNPGMKNKIYSLGRQELIKEKLIDDFKDFLRIKINESVSKRNWLENPLFKMEENVYISRNLYLNKRMIKLLDEFLTNENENNDASLILHNEIFVDKVDLIHGPKLKNRGRESVDNILYSLFIEDQRCFACARIIGEETIIMLSNNKYERYHTFLENNSYNSRENFFLKYHTGIMYYSHEYMPDLMEYDLTDILETTDVNDHFLIKNSKFRRLAKEKLSDPIKNHIERMYGSDVIEEHLDVGITSTLSNRFMGIYHPACVPKFTIPVPFFPERISYDTFISQLKEDNNNYLLSNYLDSILINRKSEIVELYTCNYCHLPLQLSLYFRCHDYKIHDLMNDDQKLHYTINDSLIQFDSADRMNRISSIGNLGLLSDMVGNHLEPLQNYTYNRINDFQSRTMINMKGGKTYHSFCFERVLDNDIKPK